MSALNMPPTNSMRCPSCGISQDPENPLCKHLLARKAGRVGSRVTRERYGLEHYAKLGRRTAMARWGTHYRPEEIDLKAKKGSK
jgi:hypothetical protein